MSLQSLNLENCKKMLAPRAPDAHKGLFGHVLVIGGDYGMGGAVRLAGEAALRSGAGLVTVVTRPEHAFAMMASCPELMCYGVLETTLEAVLIPLFKRATVLLLGPGLGQQVWGKALYEFIFKHWSGDLIVDGDGLNLLATHRESKKTWILTPHPGEASRLLNTLIPDNSIEFIQSDRLSALQALHKAYQGTIVLKGADTVILGESGTPQICKGSNPAMATAGMGDILSGLIAGLVAQKMPLEAAAQLGVCVHAQAGVLAANGRERGMLASELLEQIARCLN